MKSYKHSKKTELVVHYQTGEDLPKNNIESGSHKGKD